MHKAFLLGMVAAISVAAVASGPKPRSAALFHHRITAKRAGAIAARKLHGEVAGKILPKADSAYVVTVRNGTMLRRVLVNARTGKIQDVRIIPTRQTMEIGKIQPQKTGVRCGPG